MAQALIRSNVKRYFAPISHFALEARGLVYSLHQKLRVTTARVYIWTRRLAALACCIHLFSKRRKSRREPHHPQTTTAVAATKNEGHFIRHGLRISRT